jgi:predicted kinase
MSDTQATLHLMCGKIAAGKSTLTALLAAAPNTILVSEDHWLARLYPDEIVTVADYVRCAARLRAAIGPHVASLLHIGLSIVLDFPANTVATRNWMRDLFEQAGAAHQLHFLDVPDEVCKARLRARNATGKHEFATTDAEFDLITSYFVPPADAEGFNVVRHAGGTQ